MEALQKHLFWNFLMANMIVVLPETVSRPEKQFSKVFNVD